MRAHEALVMDMMRAVEDRDGARIVETYGPDVEFLWPPSVPRYGGVHKGTEAVVAMNLAFTDVWDPLQPTDEWRQLNSRVVASNDDEVVVQYHQRGIDTLGRVCDTEVLALYRVEGDKVTRLQMFYFDPQSVSEFVRQAVAPGGEPGLGDRQDSARHPDR
jgi:ketosteroid isomerase-like protein